MAQNPAMSQEPAGFVAALPSDEMRQMLTLWVRSWRSGELPSRPPFEPTELPQVLPYTQLHECRSGGRYFCKLSGTQVVEALGFESTNKYIDEVIAPRNLASRTRLLDLAIDSRLPLHYSGYLVVPGSEWKWMHRLLLPFQQGNQTCVLSVLKFAGRDDIPALAAREASSDGIHGMSLMSQIEVAILRSGTGSPSVNNFKENYRRHITI